MKCNICKKGTDDKNKRSVIEKPKRKKKEPIDKIINRHFETEHKKLFTKTLFKGNYPRVCPKCNR